MAKVGWVEQSLIYREQVLKNRMDKFKNNQDAWSIYVDSINRLIQVLFKEKNAVSESTFRLLQQIQSTLMLNFGQKFP